MSRFPKTSHEDGVENGDVEGVVSERDPVRSVDSVVYHKFKVVVDGQAIYDFGGEEE